MTRMTALLPSRLLGWLRCLELTQGRLSRRRISVYTALNTLLIVTSLCTLFLYAAGPNGYIRSMHRQQHLPRITSCPVATAATLGDIAPTFREQSLSFSLKRLTEYADKKFCAISDTSCPRDVRTRDERRIGLKPMIQVFIEGRKIRHEDPKLSVYPGRVETMLDSLKHALKSGFVPPLNVSLLLYAHDGCPRPLFKKAPVFAYASHLNCTSAIPIPAFPTEHNPLFENADFSKLQSSVQAARATLSPPPWDNKHSTIIWRGSNTDGGLKAWGSQRGARSKLAVLSTMFPRVLDAKFSRDVFDTSPSGDVSLKAVGAPVQFASFFDHKYVVDLPGVGSSFRYSSLLLGDSVVVTASEYVQWFSYLFRSRAAVAYVHEDLSTIVAEVAKLQADDDLARGMVAEMRRVVDLCFRTEVLDYHWGLMLEWYQEHFRRHAQQGAVQRGAT